MGQLTTDKCGEWKAKSHLGMATLLSLAASCCQGAVSGDDDDHGSNSNQGSMAAHDANASDMDGGSRASRSGDGGNADTTPPKNPTQTADGAAATANAASDLDQRDAATPTQSPSNPGEPLFDPSPVDDGNETHNDELSPPNAGISGRCSTETVRGASQSGIRKFTKSELLATLKSALSAHDWYEMRELQLTRDYTYIGVDSREPMQVLINQYPEDFSYKAGEDFQQTYGRDQLRTWVELSDIVGKEFAEAGWAASYAADGCFEQETASDDCYQQFIGAFGSNAVRRPLSIEETERWAALSPGRSTKQAVGAIVSHILQSPQFLYQLELAPKDAESRVPVSPFDIASRLSYTFTGNPPDSTLLSAAESGELETLDAIRAHAERLVQSDEARAKLMGFFRDWLGLNHVVNPPWSWANYKMIPTDIEGLYHAERLASLYTDEAERFIEYVVWDRKGSFEDLLTLPLAFATDSRLQAIYQTESQSDGITPVDAPGHPGVLTRAALLSSGGLSPSPIHRGVRVKSRVLCQEIPSPDFSIVASRLVDLTSLDSSTLPNYEITAQITSSPTCNACHQYINPIGFLFETYNPLGQREPIQRVLLDKFDFPQYGQEEPATPDGVTWAQLTQFELPPPQEVIIEDGLSGSFETSDDLISALGKSDVARACMSVRFFRHLQRRSETEADACSIKDSQAIMSQGSILDAFVASLVNEDIFWRQR